MHSADFTLAAPPAVADPRGHPAAAAREKSPLRGANPTSTQPAPLHRPPSRLTNGALDVALVGTAAGLSVALAPWVARSGETLYQELLRTTWLLASGGRGLQLDFWTLPLPPLLYLGASALFGWSFADTWLPVAMALGIVLVLTRLLLRGYPVEAKLVAAIPLLASPFFYLLQQHLNILLYVLILGVQLATLRSFRLQPTVARVSAAVAINILLSLTSYAALVAILAAVVYLVLIANRGRETNVAAWRAMLWLYVPFSLSGYLVWAAYWAVAGTRLKTSHFTGLASQDPQMFNRLLQSFFGDLAIPLVILLGIAAGMAVFAHRPDTRMRGGRTQVIAWSTFSFAGVGLLLLGVQSLLNVVPVGPEIVTFSLILLVPAAVGSVYGQARNVFLDTGWRTRALLGLAVLAVLGAFPAQYMYRPAVLREGLPPDAPRIVAEREAARSFSDPGGRVLADPRFTATFLLQAGIDPHRLLTPFDAGFPSWVASPPADVTTVVVTDHPDDLVGGNYPALRLLRQLPDMRLESESRAGTTDVRAFVRAPVELPSADAPRAVLEPYASAEDRLLSAVLRRLGPDLLPIRPDGWAYAVDVGNFLIYAGLRGDAALFGDLDRVVRAHYLTTSLADVNALYTVAWRAQPGVAAEASGTTETLRVTEGYLTAAERWDNAGLLRLAQLTGHAYARHEQPAGPSNRWFIRNYYNYGTKEFATNTFVVDFYPIVLHRLAERTGDTELRRVADESVGLLHAAQHSSGLFWEMYQPEIRTIYPDIEFFSPNGISKVYDAVEVALGLTGLSPADEALAERTLEFVRSRRDQLSSQYNLTDLSGSYEPVSPAVWAGVARLATARGDLEFARYVVDRRLVPLIEGFIADDDPPDSWYFDAIVMLLALREFQDVAEHAPSAQPHPDEGQATASLAPAHGANSRIVLEERFTTHRAGWPDVRDGTVGFTDGAYRLFVHQPGAFVAVRAPIAVPLQDVAVTANFRKVGGPPGGGYGLILRDERQGAGDGVDQGGRYYVLEVGDLGEIGIWRRDGDHWTDLVPWTPSAAVRPGHASNELVARASGPRLTLMVNGVQVAEVEDVTLAEGGIGVFAGGDLNDVFVDLFRVETLETLSQAP